MDICPMSQPRFTHTSVSTSDYQNIIVFGGYEVGPLRTVEVYNVLQKQWTKCEDVDVERYLHCSILIQDWLLKSHNIISPFIYSLLALFISTKPFINSFLSFFKSFFLQIHSFFWVTKSRIEKCCIWCKKISIKSGWRIKSNPYIYNKNRLTNLEIYIKIFDTLYKLFNSQWFKSLVTIMSLKTAIL